MWVRPSFWLTTDTGALPGAVLDTVTAAAAVDEVAIVVVVPAAFVVCGVMVVTERERESR